MMAALLPAASSARTSVSAQEAYEIEVEAYIYFYPLVTMDVTRERTDGIPGSPTNSLANKFFHIRHLPSGRLQSRGATNLDTLTPAPGSTSPKSQ